MAKIRGYKPDLWTDEDFVELSMPARLLWLGMWTFACDNGHLADKPKQIKMRVLPTDDVNCAELIRELVDHGQVIREDGWLTTPNFERHQRPDRRYFTTCTKPGCAAPPETVSQRQSRRVHGVQTVGTPSATTVATSSAQVDGDGEGEVNKNVQPRPEVEALCELLAQKIADNGSKRPTVTKAWLDDMRRMLDLDGRSVEEVRWIINWCQGHSFWSTNILSVAKLRKQFDAMKLQVKRDRGEKPTPTVTRIPKFTPPDPPPELADDPIAEREWIQARRREHERQYAS